MSSEEYHPAVVRLFEYTRSKVTEQDILDFSFNDPGYWSYVKRWTGILRSGSIPLEADFDVSETIALTGWGRAENESDPGRFRRYRRFTTSVGIALLHRGYIGDVVRDPVYLARDLLVDLDLSSDRHPTLVRDAAECTRRVLISEYPNSEFPFFTFALMILAQRVGDWSASERAAAQLLEDDRVVRVRESPALGGDVRDDSFLFGVTWFDQFHEEWISMARELRNPNNHFETELVIDTLTRGDL